MEIKAIETRYKGYRFRSRLEARWAVFFDALKVKWEYEIEGFSFGSRRYLPDFFLSDLRVWVEVKPLVSIEEQRDIRLNMARFCLAKAGASIESIDNSKYKFLDSENGCPSLCLVPSIPIPKSKFQKSIVIFGSPWVGEHKLYATVFEDSSSEDGLVHSIADFESQWCYHHGLNYTWIHSPQIFHAYKAARSARFEHGESGGG